MKKAILILSCALLMQFGLRAEDDIKESLNPLFSGVPFLSIAPDSRSGGMGDVGAATTPDVFSQHWNPAKYAFMESPAGFAFSYTPWLKKLVNDINLSYVVGYWKFDEVQAVSMSFKYFSLGNVTLRQDQYDEVGIQAHPNDFSIDVAYSRLLSEKFSASVGFRYIRSDLDTKAASDGGGGEMYPANSFAVDIAAFYRTPITLGTGDAFLAFGGHISNFGTKVSYDEKVTKNFLPTNLRLGGSFDYPFDNFNRLSINADINKLLIPTPSWENKDEYNDVTALSGLFKSFGDAPGGFKEELQEIMWAVGLEYSYNQQFFVRGGYSHESDYKGGRKYFTAGLGFKLTVFQLDAGYVIATSPSNPLDQTLRFSLSFDLFGIRDLFN